LNKATAANRALILAPKAAYDAGLMKKNNNLNNRSLGSFDQYARQDFLRIVKEFNKLALSGT